MKWICRYAEFDTDRNGIEQEPFTFDADNYDDAVVKANEELSKYYNVVEFEVCEEE